MKDLSKKKKAFLANCKLYYLVLLFAKICVTNTNNLQFTD